MAKENYSKYEMNGVLKVLPFSHVSLHKSNTTEVSQVNKYQLACL